MTVLLYLNIYNMHKNNIQSLTYDFASLKIKVYSIEYGKQTQRQKEKGS